MTPLCDLRPAKARRVIASALSVAGDFSLAARMLDVSPSELLRALVQIDKYFAGEASDKCPRTSVR